MINVKILGEALPATKKTAKVAPQGKPAAPQQPSLKPKIGDISDPSTFATVADPQKAFNPQIPQGLKQSILPLAKLINRIKHGTSSKMADFKKFDSMISGFINSYKSQEASFHGDVPDWSQQMKEEKGENYYLSLLHNHIKDIGDRDYGLLDAATTINDFLNTEYGNYKRKSTYVKKIDPSSRVRYTNEDIIKVIKEVIREMLPK